MSAAENRAPARQAAKEPKAQSAATPSPFPPIADELFLSDCHTGALVAPDRTIDWSCVPRFDAPSVFGSLLDRQAGSFPLRAIVAPHHHRQMGVLVPGGVMPLDRHQSNRRQRAGARFPRRDRDVRARLVDPRCRVINPEGGNIKRLRWYAYQVVRI